MTLRFPSSRGSEADRRRDPRLPVCRPVKLQCLQTGRYLPGRTTNLSSGGALVEVDHPSLLVPGQAVRLGIGWTSQQTVLAAEALLSATVLRSAGFGRTQTVALAFAQRQQLALTG